MAKAKQTPTAAPDTLPPASRIHVRAASDGYRRAGRAWTLAPQVVDIADLTAEQLAALHADPRITVEPAQG